MPRLLFCGDVGFRTNNEKLPPEILKLINAVNLFIFNCETAITYSNNSIEKKTAIKISPENVQFFEGIESEIIAIVANNHITDYGRKGMEDTIGFLKRYGININGLKGYFFKKNIEGKKIGFLSYCRYGNRKYVNIITSETLREIRKSKQEVDFLVVNLHWGYEYISYPHPKDIRFARDLVDEGVDLIIGHHPHVIQGYEIYREKFIFYSLGNLQFSRPEHRINSDIGLMVDIELTTNRVNVIPIRINQKCLPVVLEGREKELVIKTLKRISNTLQCNDLMYSLRWHQLASKTYLETTFKAWNVRVKRYGLRHFLLMLRFIVSVDYIKMYMGFLLGGFLHKQKSIFEDRKK